MGRCVRLGVVCTGMSFVLYFRVVAAAGSVVASAVTYIIPVFGLLLGVVVLGESVEATTVAGMALIVAGVAGVMYAPWLDSLATRSIARSPACLPDTPMRPMMHRIVGGP